MINTKQYDEMWQKFQKGLITQEVWTEFCNKVLAQILDKHPMTQMANKLGR
jgi:hypothetical protein